MGRKLYSYEIKEIANKFLKCENLRDLGNLGLNINMIQILGLNPPYYTFEIRKSHGGTRTIEAPENNIKTIQKQIKILKQCMIFKIVC